MPMQFPRRDFFVRAAATGFGAGLASMALNNQTANAADPKPS